MITKPIDEPIDELIEELKANLERAECGKCRPAVCSRALLYLLECERARQWAERAECRGGK